MISFVVLHYLVTSETIRCVQSILNWDDPNVTIVVVDNSSPNDSYTALKSEFKNTVNVHVVQNLNNIGYAGGIDYGYAYARDVLHAEFIVTMNNDMEFQGGSISDKVKWLYQENNFDVLGPDIVSTTTKKHQNPEPFGMFSISDVEHEISRIQYLKKHTTKLKIKSFVKKNKLLTSLIVNIKGHLSSRYQKLNVQKSDVVLHGSCYIFSPSYIKRRPYALYPLTSFYCEAQILSYECRYEKLMQLYSPEIVVYHHEDVATNAVEGDYYHKMLRKYDRLLDSLSIFKDLIRKNEKVDE
ncbi:hypothetical protein BVG98_07465 [Lacticaseibacillus rhamnosus]|nr:hypothetical protein BVG98_07465 [Lacticaseibacillus rhamnosus]